MAINVKNKLVTLGSLGVAYSAEQDAREEADKALSTRIDNIVAPDGDPSLTEVSDARVSGSTTYNTLKARLDADKAAIGTEISQLSADLDDLDERVTDIEAGGGGGSGGSSTLAGLTDTNISNKADGQVLTYDGTSHKWINKTSAVADNSLIVTVSGTSVYRTCDKTYTEIYNAIRAGKTVVAVDSTGVVYPYAGLMAQDGITFIALGISVVYNKTATLTGYLIGDMSGSTVAIRQDQASNFYATNETYTKNEVDNYVTNRLNNYYTGSQIDEKIGDIETLLAAI